MNLASAFAASAQKRPDKIALYWGEREFTYAKLLKQSCAVAAQLAGQYHVKAGDRVALWLKNRPEFVPALFGILNAKAVVVPINNFLKPAEVNYILQDAGIDVLITDEELAVHSPALTAARPDLEVCKVEDFAGGDDPHFTPTLSPPSEGAERESAFGANQSADSPEGTS